MQPCFGEDILEVHYINTDCSTFSFKPNKSLIEDLKHFEKDFGFSDSDTSREPYSEEKKTVGKMKLETVLEIHPDEAVFFSSKTYFINKKQKKIRIASINDCTNIKKYNQVVYTYRLKTKEKEYDVNYSFRNNIT